MLGLVDTHVHLDFPDYADNFSEVLQRAEENRVKGMISIGISPGSSQKVVEIAEKYDNIWATVGVHPHDVKSLSDHYLQELSRIAQSPQVIAVGETGLDYFKMRSPQDEQRKVFRQQIQLAKELNLPLVVHSRDAEEDTQKILEEEKAHQVGGVLHCFSGGLDFARSALEKGYYLSFAGPVTYPKSHRLKEVVKEVPLNRILLETDAPFLTPQQFRGKRNEPAYVAYIYREVASIKGIMEEELEESCMINARRLFGILPT